MSSCATGTNAANQPDASSNRVQAQDSLTDQVLRVWKLALEQGENDAADWIRRTFDADAIPNSAAEKLGYEIAIRLIEKNLRVAQGLLQSAANEASLFDAELEHELDNCADRLKRAYPVWQGAFQRIDRTAT